MISRRVHSLQRLLLSGAAALAPLAGHAQVRSELASAAGQTRTIPNVLNIPVSSAIDALAGTRLEIVQVTRFTTTSAAGTVVEQRPRAGTPVSATRAETLFVAAMPRDSLRTGMLARVITDGAARSAATIAPTRPPVPRAEDVAAAATTVQVAPGREAQQVMPELVVQEPAVVPDLYGRSPETAAAVLARLDLVLGTQARDYSDTVPAGRVFRQYPPPRTRVAAKTPVSVWYSAGPHPTEEGPTVPSVVGLSLDAARDSLGRVRLRAGRVDTVYRRGGGGTVLHQEPHAGTPAHVGGAVDLSIVVSPITVPVPSVIGYSRDDAREILRRFGLDVGRITLVAVPGVDTVITEQTPPAGTPVEPRSLVDIIENRPPAARRVVVPDLAGLTAAAAAQHLSRDSLFLGNVGMTGDASTAIVTAQDPRAGDIVFLYSRVNVVLAPPADGGTGPEVELIRVPFVVNLTAEVARRTLLDSGFARIRLAGDSITAASVVDSQAPAAGIFVRPGTTISLFVEAIPVRGVPYLIGMREADARANAEADLLTLAIRARRRAFRWRDAVVTQEPVPPASAPADATIAVELEIPIVPLLPTFFALGLTAMVGEAARRGRRHPKPKGAAAVTLRPVGTTTEAPTLAAEPGTLIHASLALRYQVDAGTWRIETNGSLIKTEKRLHA